MVRVRQFEPSSEALQPPAIPVLGPAGSTAVISSPMDRVAARPAPLTGAIVMLAQKGFGGRFDADMVRAMDSSCGWYVGVGGLPRRGHRAYSHCALTPPAREWESFAGRFLRT